MDKTLPDFSRMTLRERMDWLTDASEDAKKILASFANSHDKELSALCKAMQKGAKQGKVDDSILVNVKIKAMPKGIVRDTSHVKLRSMADKLGRHGNAIAARVHTIEKVCRDTGKVTRQIVHDLPENDAAPREPAWKAGQSKLATPRPDSPFKRSGKAVASVVIVRKVKS